MLTIFFSKLTLLVLSSMEIKTGHFYVRSRHSGTYAFLQVRKDSQGYFYSLNRNELKQYLERGCSDDLDQYEIIRELPMDFEPSYSATSIAISATNNFGHRQVFNASNLVRFADLLDNDPHLAKALDIDLARQRKRIKPTK